MIKDFSFELPPWVEPMIDGSAEVFPTAEDRMRLVIALARENVRRGTGGPFGAGVFDVNGRLVAAGINLVVHGGCSILHAEMVAFALAQKKLGRHDLSNAGEEEYELAASAEPCAMCFGAIPWSGVTRLVYGSRDQDARQIGFDEGPKLPEWRQALEERGIEVGAEVLRQEAVAVLDLYRQMGGPIYNSGSTDESGRGPRS